MTNMAELRERVLQFKMLKLPGQVGMHMGTMYLINDLVKAIDVFETDLRDVEKVIEKLEAQGKQPMKSQ